MPVDENPNGNAEQGNDGFATAFAEFSQARTPADDAREPLGIEPGNAEPERPSEAPSSDTSPGAPAPAADAPDIWANAPPELIAERDRILADAERHRQSDLSQRGRLSAYQRKINELEARQPHTPQATEGAQVPASSEGAAAPAADALGQKIAQLREDYPDVAGPLIEMLEAQRTEINSLKSTVGDVAIERDAVAINQQYAELERRHPDFKTVAADPNYKAWVADQPEQVRALAESWDAREAGHALTLFKTERALAQAAGGGTSGNSDNADAVKRQRQLDGGRDVRSRSGVPAVTGAPNEFDAAFSHYASKRRR